MTDNRIDFFDTTLRDGEQSPGCSMHVEEKLRMAHQLCALGVDIIEAGFPIASEGDRNAVECIAREVRGPRIAALARARREDIEMAAQATEPARDRARIHIFLASSDLHLEYKLKISREEALVQAHEAVTLAKSLCDDVQFSPEDATRSDRDYLCEMVQVVVDAGATVINVPDTVGYSLPQEYASFFTMFRERIRGIENVTLSAHCHDDLGLATANALAAMSAGARQTECTINGIGERAGNAALEEIAAAMRVRSDQLPFTNGICMEQLYPTSQMLADCISFGPAPNKAVVGDNAFAHEAGIHQHGVLANPLCYEIMTPESVGVQKNRMVLGKHSGRHALRSRFAELGHALNASDVEIAYQGFVKLADRKKRIYDQDLISLLSALPSRQERRREAVNF
jgi:2-isopropylmalate synthase